jgi:hypothetical protein
VKTVSELSEGTALIEKLLKDEANEQNIGLVYKLRGGKCHNRSSLEPRHAQLWELNREQLKHEERAGGRNHQNGSGAQELFLRPRALELPRAIIYMLVRELLAFVI